MKTSNHQNRILAAFVLCIHCIVSLWAAILNGVDVPTLWQLPSEKEPAFLPVLFIVTGHGRLSDFWLLGSLASSLTLAYLILRGRFWAFAGIVVTAIFAVFSERIGELFACLAFSDCHPLRVHNVVVQIMLIGIPALLLYLFLRNVVRENG